VKQVSEYLERIYVPKPIFDLWVEYIEKPTNAEMKEAGEIRQSLTNSLKGCVRKLENLNQMRLRDLISDEEYIKEKKKLIDEKIALEEAIKNDGEIVDDVNRETIDRVVFAHEAMERFKNGSLSEKRTILGKIGSNLTLKRKKLIINAATPFIFLQNGLPSIREEFERIEPLKNEANIEQFAFFWPRFVLGWRLIENIRASFRQKIRRENSPSGSMESF